MLTEHFQSLWENVQCSVWGSQNIGQVVSGTRQNEKNIDLRISKGRKSLYSLLGPAFATKCLLSPAVKLHIYKTFTCPVIRSGLSTFVLRTNTIEPLAIFERKCLKSILHLSKTTPTPSIYLGGHHL